MFDYDYFKKPARDHRKLARETLFWLGAVGLIALALTVVIMVTSGSARVVDSCCLDPARKCKQCPPGCCPQSKNCCCLHVDKYSCPRPEDIPAVGVKKLAPAARERHARNQEDVDEPTTLGSSAPAVHGESPGSGGGKHLIGTLDPKQPWPEPPR